jgi:porin
VLELTYRLALRKGAVYIQPDLQYVFRPGGTGRIQDALVIGAQVAINF